MKLRSKLFPSQYADDLVVCSPCLQVRIGDSASWAVGVIDTGAPLTLVSIDFAREVLKLQELEQAEQIPLHGYDGGVSRPGWLHRADLHIRPLDADEPVLTYPDSVIVIAKIATDDVLLGQHDFLERSDFRQRNQPPSDWTDISKSR